MKRLFFCLLVLFGTTSLFAQSPLEQKVSVDANNMELEEVLYQLIDQHNVKLIFNNEILSSRKITVQLSNVTLRTALQYILRGTDIGFKELEKQVALIKIESPVPQDFTISGFLEDEETGERLIGASVYDKKSKRGTITNAYGFYSLTLTEGKADLIFSYLGYSPIFHEIDLIENTRINRSLKTDLTLNEVVVYATDSTTVATSDISVDVILTTDMKRLPSLGGENDVLRITHLLPGVQTGTDGVGGIYVRGGNSGQNLILIDGVPVYYIAHAVGLFSIFNTEAIRTAKLVKGGFPAHYGGRLSSVLDIRTKEGNMKAVKGWTKFGLLTGSAGVEGPLIKDKSSFFLSGRISYLDMYLKPYSKRLKNEIGEKGETAYDFYDLNAKINYAFSQEDKLYLSYYSGGDMFFDDGKETEYYVFEEEDEPVTFRYHNGYNQSLQWNNNVAALRWNHLFSDKLFANTSITYSKLAVDFEFTTLDSLFQDDDEEALLSSYTQGSYFTGIEDLGIHLDFDLVPNAFHYLRYGLSVHSKKFNPGAVIRKELIDEPSNGPENNPLVRAVEYTAYFENEFILGKWTINAGVRANVQSVIKRNYRILEPRLSVKWQAQPKLRIKASYSRMSQFLHLLSSSGIGLPTDLWIPSTDKIAPQIASQFDAGFDFNLGKKIQVDVSGYYKEMENLLSFSEGASLYNDWRKNVTQGNGSSYGAEFLIKKAKGKTTGWLAYTLSFTDRQFDRINFGNVYPFKYDRRHDLKIVLVHRFNPVFEITGNWIYSTGFAYNLPLEKYQIQLSEYFQGTTTPIISNGPKNHNRMPDYHRLDLNLNIYLNWAKADHKISIGVSNAYNKQNPLYYQLRRDLEIEGNEVKETNKFVQVLLLPIVPSLSYSLNF
jgi:outer membrane cobalamin receptor